jgi:hypothetical protein
LRANIKAIGGQYSRSQRSCASFISPGRFANDLSSAFFRNAHPALLDATIENMTDGNDVIVAIPGYEWPTCRPSSHQLEV